MTDYEPLQRNTELHNGRYKIRKMLAHGGMGAIYLAHDLNFGEPVPVAIKENFVQTGPGINRAASMIQFRAEAGVLRRLKNDHLPDVIDLFTVENRQYLVMDFIGGKDLWSMVEGKDPLSEAQALNYIIQACEAVKFLHKQEPPIIHRDIKPQNIIVTPDDKVFLVDFGLSKVGGATVDTRLGAQGGTPGYAPPEQFSRVAPTRRASDIYALGATLYAILTAVAPPDSSAIMSGLATFEPPELLNPQLSDRVSRAITHAMETRITDRPASVTDWQAELKALRQNLEAEVAQSLLARGKVETAPPAAPPPPPQTLAGNKGPIIIGVVVGLLLIAVAGFFVFGGNGEAAPTNEPTDESTVVVVKPSDTPTNTLTPAPSATETSAPTDIPTAGPTDTATPTKEPSATLTPTNEPTETATATAPPTLTLTEEPTIPPTAEPTAEPTEEITDTPTPTETAPPTAEPTDTPTPEPTIEPTDTPTVQPELSGHIAVPLMFGSEPRVYIVGMDGVDINTLGSARQPAHNPVGDKLVVNGDGGSMLLLRVTNADGSSPQEFGDQGLNAHSHPAWSPDGSQVIYNDRPTGTDYSIFNRMANDKNPGFGQEVGVISIGPIFHSNPLYPHWSSQGVIFRGCDSWTGQNNTCGLWLVSDQSAEIKQLTDNVNHLPTDVNNSTVIFSWREQNDWNIYKLDITSGTITQLTSNPAADALGTLSPDGQTVAFLSNRNGGLAVWYVSINGGPATKMFGLNPDWGGLRDDGWSEEKLSWGK